MNPKNLIRPQVRKLHAYVPGEQPKVRGLIKLNTNENPYPPSPKVQDELRKAVDGRLRLYPNPAALGLREGLAKLHKCRPENVIIGNGSDELLALATRAFVEPVPVGVDRSSLSGKARSRSTVQYFDPSYSLYPVLSEIHGAVANPVRLDDDFGIPDRAVLRKRGWDFDAALTYVTTPNAPSGRGYASAQLDDLCAWQKRVTILDEAYADFAGENALSLALKHPHVLVSRTFSKAYSLCFQRIGYFVGHRELIAALDRIRDSYNVNGLGQVAAIGTLGSLSYYRKNIRQIIRQRALIARSLSALGFEVLPSETNFLLVRPPAFPACEWQKQLRDEKIIVRWFGGGRISEFLRVTIGTEPEMVAFLAAVRKILA
ncbi:MAG: aminotransferase class I/II-fold pyridoxal phosphate-dependent enzyme [Verrucomicrobiae bacterium]|nr:aminotransferase class I/II-fold pyridoxal phosphate-dependent enzyme [Verrucomicrobiae bacterium]